MAKVLKTEAELYQVRHNTIEGWGDLFLICGEESVRIAINSDYGVFAHNWTRCGCNPKEFLAKINFNYCMEKLTNCKLYIKAPEQYPTQVKQRIIEARREVGSLTKEEAREAWIDMLDVDHDSGDLYFRDLTDHHLFKKVFGDYEYLPDAKKIDPRCQDFWDYVWLPFIEQLKAELEQNKTEYYCQCNNKDCGNWFEVSKIGETCKECNKGTMQPQDVEPY